MRLYFWYSKLMEIGAKLCVFVVLSLIALALMQAAFAAAGLGLALFAGVLLALLCAWAYERIVQWMAS